MLYLSRGAKVILIAVLTPVVILVFLAIGLIYAMLSLLALPFILAAEELRSALDDAAVARRELDALQQVYPQVPRRLLRQARWEDLMQRTHEDATAPTPLRDAVQRSSNAALKLQNRFLKAPETLERPGIFS